MLSKIYIKDDTPGSLSNINEIKILICHTIKEANRPIDQNQLNEVFQINRTVNYFNFCAAVEEMLQSHHLMQTSDQKLSLTKLGFDTAELFKKNLQYSTVKKTLKTLKQINERDRMQKNGKTSIEERKDGTRFEGHFHNGMKDGAFVEKDANGNTTRKGTYRNDVLQ